MPVISQPTRYRLGLRFETVVMAALAGCAVGPNFQRPPPPQSGYEVNQSPTPSPRLTAGEDIAQDWYLVFGSSTLNELVQQALQANPDLEASRRSLTAARYELQAVAGQALPQLVFDTKAMRARVNGSALYEPADKFQATANIYTLGPSLAYDLDVFGRLRRTIEAQAAQTTQVAHQALNVRITLVSEVVETAFEVAAADEQIRVTDSLISDLDGQYRLTAKLEEKGKLTRSDTLQAQAQLESIRASRPGLQKQLRVYQNALLRLIGSAPTDRAAPPIALGDFRLPKTIPVSLPAQLVRQRPDILEAEDLWHQGTAQVGVAKAARFPDFQLTAQYAQQSGMLNDLISKAAQTWSVGLDMSTPIFEGGRLRAREKEARQRLLQVSAQYRSSLINAFMEVANALDAIEKDSESYAARTTSLDIARANRDLAGHRLERGKVSELDVLTAQQQYENAALEQVRANAQRFTDIAELIHALGGGWWNDPAAPNPNSYVPAEAEHGGGI
jgi:NodT family efflux transporter outer membrane factor (OMF) lipoprotein